MKSKMHKQLRLPLMAVLFVLAGKAAAQEVILDQEFDFSDVTGWSELNGSNYSQFPNWTFEKCYIIGGSNLQIGSSTGNGGYVQTPNLSGYAPYAKATIRLSNTSSTAKPVSISSSNCTLSQTGYTIGAKQEMIITTILSSPVASPFLTISSEYGKAFDLMSIKVENLGEVLFFETFKNVNGDHGNNNFSEFLNYQLNDHDCSTFDNSTISDQKSSRKANGFIYIQDGYYKIKSLPKNPSGKVILSFLAAGATNGAPLLKVNGETITIEQGKWKEYNIVLSNITQNTSITFNATRIFLDDVLITELPTIALDQMADNGSVITRDMNQLRTVELHRPLIKDNWNTMCLPFAVSRDIIATALGSGANPEVRTLTGISDGVFNFAEYTGTVAAGTPFLLKVSKVVTDPWTIRDVVIEQKEPLQLTFDNANGYKLAGTYSPVNLAFDGTNVFLGNDGILYFPASGQNTMNGMRAYFIIPSGEHNARVQQEESSGIATMTAAPVREAATYDLTGRRMPDAVRQPGLYIQGGRKVIVR